MRNLHIRLIIRLIAWSLVLLALIGVSGVYGSSSPSILLAATEQPVPQELKTIPAEYYQAADHQGTLTDLYYDTYESFSYNEKSKPLKKHAVVYLPYGYRKDQKYDVFYLMHGGGGDETATLGTPKSPSSFKNIIDHAIAAGEMRRLIIV